jgi:fatty acid desaturase
MSSRGNIAMSATTVSFQTQRDARQSHVARRGIRAAMVVGWVMLGLLAMGWVSFLAGSLLFGIPIS